MCHTGLTRSRPHNGKPHLLSPAEAGTGRATHAGRRPKNRSRKGVKRHLRGRGETCLSDLVPGVSLLFGCGRLSVWSVLFRVLFSVPVCCSPCPCVFLPGLLGLSVSFRAPTRELAVQHVSRAPTPGTAIWQASPSYCSTAYWVFSTVSTYLHPGFVSFVFRCCASEMPRDEHQDGTRVQH